LAGFSGELGYVCLDTAERLLMAGVVLPATTAFALLDSVLDRTSRSMRDSDSYLLSRIVALFPFVDDPAAGIAKVREVIGMQLLTAHELRDVVTALGESRADAATELLYELGCDAQIFEHCEVQFINALCALDTPHALELLLGFVDPSVRGISRGSHPHREDALAARIVGLARGRVAVVARLLELCDCDLAEAPRQLLSKVMYQLGTTEALVANLRLLDDSKGQPIPQGIRDQLHTSFVERRAHGQNPNWFTERARASNELRVQLFRMAIGDEKRRRSAFKLLGQLEVWRLEHGRPAGEPRHPDFASGQGWPPNQPVDGWE
jgi:hypothetical protein